MDRFIKRRSISRILIITLVVIIAIGMLQVYINETNSNSDNVSTEEKYNTMAMSKEQTDKQDSKVISLDDLVKPEKQPKKEIDISDVLISSDVEGLIKNQDVKNADKNIKNYKKLLKELDVLDQNTTEFKRLMKNGHKVSDIFISYEFLYENFGLTKELEGLLNKKEGGKPWDEVFKEYKDADKEFVPTSFKPGFLEKLLKTPDITGDDVMIADRISQKGLKKFDELIAMKKEGKKWKEINSELGLVNTAEKLSSIALTKERVEKQVKRTGLDENQIVNALIICEKYGIDDEVIVDKVNKGSKIEEIYAGVYISKYN